MKDQPFSFQMPNFNQSKGYDRDVTHEPGSYYVIHSYDIATIDKLYGPNGTWYKAPYVTNDVK